MTGAGLLFQAVAVSLWLIFHIDNKLEAFGELYDIKRRYYGFNKAYRWRMLVTILKSNTKFTLIGREVHYESDW
jgi:hypothetical protein